MFRAALLLFIALPNLTFADWKPNWEEYHSRDGRFEITFPNSPKKDEKDVSTTPGGRTIHVMTVRASGLGRTIFSVSTTDYPKGVRKLDAEPILKAALESMTGTDGKISDEEKLTLKVDGQAVEGRKATIKAGRTLIYARVYLQGDRLYQVLITGRQEDMRDEVNAKFWYSFKITK